MFLKRPDVFEAACAELGCLEPGCLELGCLELGFAKYLQPNNLV
jgi:hypothetical protein